jgi:MFS transporter, PAT family, beta-lactamase induction signal transducer AmpG
MTTLSTSQSLRHAFTSWRTGAVSLLSFSSGLPLGLILTAIPFWLQQQNVDIKTIGLITATQIPFTFKFLWSPLMDRFAPSRARKRAWIAVGQTGLAACTFALAWDAHSPTVASVAVLLLLMSFAGATQDIAVDAYAVEALRPEEQGAAVGARSALYRAAMFVSGALFITWGPTWGWPVLYGLLGATYVGLLAVTWFAPEPELAAGAPATLREAVWLPFVGFFRNPHALQIAAFVLLYKFADNLAGALVRPFLGQLGYSPVDIGVASGVIGLFGALAGTFVGGVMTQGLGVGRALWIFGIVQGVSNVGYAVVAQVGLVPAGGTPPGYRWLMYAAMAVESVTSGMGTGAFSVLLLRLTQRRFSATQYALFSSIFGLGRTLSGPPAGAMVDAMGWRDFFIASMFFALPGLWMLQRFVPLSARDIPPLPDDSAERATTEPPLRWGQVLARGALGAGAGTAAGYAASALLAAMKLRSLQHEGFHPLDALVGLFHPTRAVDVVDIVAAPILGLLVGCGVAAYFAARRGIAVEPPPAGAPR